MMTIILRVEITNDFDDNNFSEEDDDQKRHYEELDVNDGNADCSNISTLKFLPQHPDLF